MTDNPREVLALLNSLGFVGITAPQLKAFLKDLKLYRKIKEREQQQRREEMTKKIMSKQRTMLQEILKEKASECRSNAIDNSSESVDSEDANPLIKLRVKYVPHQEDCSDTETDEKNQPNVRNISHPTKENTVQPKPKIVKPDTEPPSLNKKATPRIKEQRKPSLHRRFDSEPNLVRSECSRTHSARAQSAPVTKSFIRPKKLRSISQERAQTKRLDPVSLYHKYQKEWKQLSLPGEAKRNALRWSIREKMLGGDPPPMPLTSKHNAVPVPKRKVWCAT